MSKRKNASDQTVIQRFNEIADSDDAISADQLRDLVQEFTDRNLSAKTVRARLRAIQARDQSVLKNARWRIDKTLAESEVEHYAKRAQSQTEAS